ncbi:MAG: hypothetical protein DYH03_19895 [Nitrospira sp. NTP1]|nr:hypothetical protein [Nitrospira sp. NTP1]
MQIGPQEKQRRQRPEPLPLSPLHAIPDREHHRHAQKADQLRAGTEERKRHPEAGDQRDQPVCSMDRSDSCRDPPGQGRDSAEEHNQAQSARWFKRLIDQGQQSVGQPGMLHPMPIRHRMGIGIGLRQTPTLRDQIQSGPEMPSQIRL